jgi:hypothetical protein
VAGEPPRPLPVDGWVWRKRLAGEGGVGEEEEVGGEPEKEGSRRMRGEAEADGGSSRKMKVGQGCVIGQPN